MVVALGTFPPQDLLWELLLLLLFFPPQELGNFWHVSTRR